MAIGNTRLQGEIKKKKCDLEYQINVGLPGSCVFSGDFPGCPRPSIALQCKIMSYSTIHSSLLAIRFIHVISFSVSYHNSFMFHMTRKSVIIVTSVVKHHFSICRTAFGIGG